MSENPALGVGVGGRDNFHSPQEPLRVAAPPPASLFLYFLIFLLPSYELGDYRV